ncbi:ABC transporter ATP-binding protein [Candidatus Nitronereus thalassa]|uniref:ATP-binding cassette domain-containing protein n=1 Tax=Candidatus Nitronereus thalassa TaxID=3020898 RepID=A0ABU3K8J1_9BACT|nr:ATP-binding cassette domain-containing protein [Candidatus Nitronereus thalassa]MDT7042760.1 ATP-binding cassette domain-containing protein [Candidatus Nitronereus thalassa]
MIDIPTAPTTTIGEALIEVRHVCTRFGSAVVHEDVSLDIYQGEVFAIAGGNGCGKSTLLREIILLLEPNSGTIRIFGQDTKGLNAKTERALHRRIGVMFQHGALFSSLNVVENVEAPLREHTDLNKRLIHEIALMKISLTGFPMNSVTKFPNELSGGMRKRASLARAIVLDPEILFLDEPTSGLDPISAGAFDDLVQQLKEWLGLTMVIVTHDLDSLWKVTDRVALLGNGRVLGTGTMEELSQSDDPLIREYFHGPRGRAAREQAWSQK